MNQRPLTREELAWLLLDAHQKCADMDRAERIAKLGHAQRWRAAELIARHIIWQARRAS